jgi:uncharacterized membrane protein YkoI
MKTYLITLLAAGGFVLVGCNKSVESASSDFNQLPPAVQKTVRAQSPNGEIASASKKTRDGVEYYEIEFREPGTNPKIEVALDGKLLNTDMAKPANAITKALTPTGAVGTKLSALPEAAQKTIQTRAPNGQITNISRSEKDGRAIYEIEFKDQGKNPTMKVAEDGTLVQDLQK